MGSLYNLYISQSYQSLVHFGSDWTASANLIQLEDGYGNGLGVSMNTDGDITAVGDITASNLYAPTISGSNGHFSNGLFVSGTISAYELKVVIESSSIIFTSGSNIIGDEANVDTQTLVGRIINTGSLEVTGSTRITGNTTITGSLVVNGLVTTPNLATTASNNFIGKEQVTGSVDINGGLTLNGSSSFTELTGSLADFSQSIDLRILNAAGILQLQSQSVILGLSRTLNFSGDDVSISISNQTGSINVRTGQFATTGSNTFYGTETISGSVLVSGSTIVNGLIETIGTQNIIGVSKITGSLLTTGSISHIGAITASGEISTSANIYAANNATTASNTFVGNQTITGSLTVLGNQILTGSLTISSSADLDLSIIGKSTFSGSVRGNVTALSITSNTASIDCSLGNFFTLSLPSGSTTRLAATNILPGETIQLRLTQPSSGYGSVGYDSNIKFSTYFPYQSTPIANAVDIISFTTFDSSSLYAVSVNYF